MPTACERMSFTDSAIFQTNNNTEEKCSKFICCNHINFEQKENISFYPDFKVIGVKNQVEKKSFY